jgi:LytS/YehU family sensor histidine kinase
LSDICTILYKSTSPFISLADEVEIIEYHLKLEQLRYTQRLNVVLRRK